MKNRTGIANKLGIITLLCAFIMPLSAHAGVVVIGNKAIGVSSLSGSEVMKAYMGKAKKLGDGTRVKFIDQSGAIKNDFLSKVIGKSKQQMKAYWAKLVFTGKGTPPASLDGDDAVKSWVASNAGGMGYIDSGSVDGSVKVLLEP